MELQAHHGGMIAELMRRRTQVRHLHAALEEAVDIMLAMVHVDVADGDACDSIERLRGVVDETRKWVE